MKRTSILIGLLSGIALPQVVSAQSSNFTIDGSISVGNYWADYGNESFYAGSVDATYQLANVGGGSIGVDLGLELFGTLGSDAFDVNHGYYALTYQGGFGKVSVGLPRSAFDTTGPQASDSVGHSAVLSEISFLGLSLVEYALISDINTYGAAFEGQSGNLAYRLSYHNISGSGDSADIIAAGAEYGFGAMTASAAVESSNDSADGVLRYKLGLQGTAGRIDYGLSYIGGDSLLISGISTVNTFGNYAINDKISVGLDLTRIMDSGDSLTITSLAAAYKVTDHFDVEASYSNLNSSGGGSSSYSGILATYNF